MTSLEELEKKLKKARQKQAFENDARARENKKKAIQKELFLLKHKKKIKLLGKAKKNLVHMSKNAQAMAKNASKKGKKKRKKGGAFGNFNFGY